MKGYIEERVVKVVEFIIASKSTVRDTAKKFNISKSTVHKKRLNQDYSNRAFAPSIVGGRAK